MNHLGNPIGMDVEPCPKALVRVLSRVVKDEVTGCWIFEGWKDDKGYGRVQVSGKHYWIHRWMYAMFRRPLVNGLTVQHKCRNPSCCNPWHLELMTHSENTADGNSNRNSAKDEIPN